MKKVAVVAVSLLAALAIGAYVLLASRSSVRPADTEAINNIADSVPAQKGAPSDNRAVSLFPPPETAEEHARVVEEAVARIAPEDYRHKREGARTEFHLYRGEIGFVDVESIMQNRDPHSVIALLQKHHVLTGADGAFEIKIDGAWQERRGGYGARYSQVIGGVSSPGRGSVSFDSSGAVFILDGVLVNPAGARPNSIKILQAEAVALARPVAVRFVEPQRARFAEAGKPLRLNPDEGHLRYSLDAANQLRAEWRVLVGTYDPPDNVEVLIDAETGAVLGAKSILEIRFAQTGGCDVEFRVCDGLLATEASCKRTLLNPVDLIYGQRPNGTWGCVAGDRKRCKEAEFKTPWETAYAARNHVSGIYKEALAGLGGSDCAIDIVVGNDAKVPPGAEAAYRQREDAIVIGEPYSGRDPAVHEEVIAHEVFHAVIEGGGDIEEGLVRSMEVLYMGGDTWEDYEFQTEQKFHSGAGTIEVVGNAIYRIYKEIRDADEVFELSLRTAEQHPADIYGLQKALPTAAKQMGGAMLAVVDRVLEAMQPPETLIGGEPAAWRAVKEEAIRVLKKPPGWWQDDEEDDSQAKSIPGWRQDDEEDDSEDAPPPGDG